MFWQGDTIVMCDAIKDPVHGLVEEGRSQDIALSDARGGHNALCEWAIDPKVGDSALVEVLDVVQEEYWANNSKAAFRST